MFPRKGKTFNVDPFWMHSTLQVFCDDLFQLEATLSPLTEMERELDNPGWPVVGLNIDFVKDTIQNMQGEEMVKVHIHEKSIEHEPIHKNINYGHSSHEELIKWTSQWPKQCSQNGGFNSWAHLHWCSFYNRFCYNTWHGIHYAQSYQLLWWQCFAFEGSPLNLHGKKLL